MTVLSDDLKNRLRLAAALALATACSTKKAAPPAADASPPDAGPADAGPSWDANADAGPSEQEQRDALATFGHDPCPGCGMGGKLPRIHTPPKTAVIVGPTESVVASSKPRFLSCYDEDLFSRPDAGGRMIVRLEVNEKGEVKKSGVVESELKGVVNVCVADVSRRIRFPSGNPPHVVLVPLFFYHEHG
jgi:hypothetical protein